MSYVHWLLFKLPFFCFSRKVWKCLKKKQKNNTNVFAKKTIYWNLFQCDLQLLSNTQAKFQLIVQCLGNRYACYLKQLSSQKCFMSICALLLSTPRFEIIRSLTFIFNSYVVFFETITTLYFPPNNNEKCIVKVKPQQSTSPTTK